MMAWTGFVAVDNGIRIFPLPDAYQGLTARTAHDALVTSGAMGQMLLFFGLGEIIAWLALSQMLEGSGRAPGDFAFDPMNFLKGKSDAEKEAMQLKELKNGRLAMLAFSGVSWRRGGGKREKRAGR